MISIVIATRNDPLLLQTLESIIENSSVGPHHIKVIEDGFVPKPEVVHFCMKRGITLTYNRQRLGPGPTRHKGGMAVDQGWIMFCDSHMEFPQGWDTLMYSYLESSSEEEIWGPQYHSNVIFDSFWHDTHYVGGADFYFWRDNLQTGKFSFVDLSPRRVQNKWAYDVPCLLGGCYIVHSNWFKKMKGYQPLIGYGSEESWLSLSTWLSGGKVSIMGTLSVTHIYQNATSTKKPTVPEWEANRLAVLKRILKPDQYEEFLSWLPIARSTKDEIESRIGWVADLQKDDPVDIGNICQSFGLQTVEEAISLMTKYHLKEERRLGA